MSATNEKLSPDQELAIQLSEFYADPLGYVMFAFPWDTDPSIQIVDWYSDDMPINEKYRKRFPNCKYGPDNWACQFLDELGEEIKKRGFDGRNAVEPIEEAIASGHGIGKSAMTGWLTSFILQTRPYSQGTVTANTGPQLESKTWPQIVKWFKKSIAAHWFDVTSGRGAMRIKHKQHPDEWFVTAQTCREENSESFQGQHAANSTSFYINDEASAIPSAIWEAEDGGLSDGEPMRFSFGNPTRNTGRFRECFGKYRHRTICRHIDSRDAQITNKERIKQQIEDEGIDSDYVKKRILGKFPSSGDQQFIASDLVDAAIERGKRAVPRDIDMSEALVIGIDFARSGTDKSVIRARRGRHVYKPHKFRERNSMKAAAIIANTIDQAEKIWGGKPDAIFGDGGGIGGPIIDRLNALGLGVIEIQFGGKCPEPQKWANMRIFMWAGLRDWLVGGCLDDDPELREDLINPEYHHHGRSDALVLESKEDMKNRGLASPDDGDALALTFAMPVAPKRNNEISRANKHKDYNPVRDRLSRKP